MPTSTLPLLAASLLAASLQAASGPAVVRRGEYLVEIMGCHDCHTPMKLGANGPEPDVSRALSGHPQDLKAGPAPDLKDGWVWAGSGTMTAFAGPWGVSFSANLTSDPETGIGRFAEADFVQAVRTGRHLGKGRPILPPMPIPSFSKATDEDLKAIYAYLKSTRPIRNAVPDPLPPAPRP
jgi:hypothetical protein